MIVRLDEDALDGFFQETFRIPKNDYHRDERLIRHKLARTETRGIAFQTVASR